MTLDGFFFKNPRFALAFSGGTDSSYLLHEAVRHGCDVLPVYVKSAFQPAFELGDALRLCRELAVELTVLPVDILGFGEVAQNDARRCYFCKKRLLGAISELARERGYGLIIDGSNASDDERERPGMAALGELGIASPLRLCGITKDAVREKSRQAGLFTWDKPAYACLATRVTTGEQISSEKLAAIEEAEEFLRELGFSDLRVRLDSETARIELPDGQFKRIVERREQITAHLGRFFKRVTVDLKGR